MTTTLILQGRGLTPDIAGAIAAELRGELEERAGHWRVFTAAATPEVLADLRRRHPVDINPLPAGFDPAAVRLLLSDMDSTFINIECADEIGDLMGIKPQVAAITAAAMRGELDFETSLRRRVALLKGADTSALEHVYHERLRLNPGAEALVEGLHARGAKFALVSGGFTFFTERLRKRLNLDYTLANHLDIEQGRITGEVHGAIVGAAAKAEFLLRLCEELHIKPAQVIAVGDGANDLQMIRLAGLGVAYHGRPAVLAEADVILNHSGLDGILAFLER
ncbi:MAG: phosphoserine phosphatase SerB [Gammaproteobacteria bacterium]|nr:phosphoserine phosphatase SerB [Gammaproteobacteria bacterium]